MKKSGFNAVPFNVVKDVKELIKDSFFFKVFADEGDNSERDDEMEDNNPTPRVDFEELIQKARNEEKKKQYSTIEKLKKQIATLTDQHNDDLLKIAALEKEGDKKKSDENKPSEDGEAIKSLKKDLYDSSKVIENLNKEIDELKKAKPVEVDRDAIEKEIREALEKEYSVKKHKDDILREHEDDLLLPELVIGDTIEELDANLEIALKRSKEIEDKLNARKGGAKKDEPKEDKPRRTPKPSNPSVSIVQDGKYSLDYLMRLDPKSKEYKEFRKEMGLK